MQLLHALAFGLSALVAEIEQRGKCAQDADRHGKERFVKKRLANGRAAQRAEAGQQPVNRFWHPGVRNQPAPLLLQPRKPCEYRLFPELYCPGFFAAPAFGGKTFVQAAKKKKRRARKQEHSAINKVNRCHGSLTAGEASGNRRRSSDSGAPLSRRRQKSSGEIVPTF
ncbi:hypothetical protein SDC9_88136 [bioreactor metagenome]|uniref:Uncharacterized protein n=1 Tax=bioreactor metagenome TaxID=1076179 RepID=A0A644ZNS8_9ZZZZ